MAVCRVTARVRAVPAAVALVLAVACSGPAADSEPGETLPSARPAVVERGKEAVAARLAGLSEPPLAALGGSLRERPTFASAPPGPAQDRPAPGASTLQSGERVTTAEGVDRPQLAAVAPEQEREPASLMGLARDQVIALLGTPSLVRRDAPAEVWQYAGEECVLDLYLYEGGDGAKSGGDEGGPARAKEAVEPGGAYRVTYFEMRARGGGSVSEPGCLTGLVGTRRSAGAG